MNFAGGGHQLNLNSSGFDIDNAKGHISVYKDDAGIVTVTVCTLEEASQGSGQCPKPVYKDCNDCQWGQGNK